MMTIYSIDRKNKISVIVALILLKYLDSNSLIKIFEILKVSYSFNSKSVKTDLEDSLIKALKNCQVFSNKPYIVPYLFHYAQAIIKKFKNLNIIDKKLNKRGYELLRNLEILAFIDLKNL